MLWKVRSRTLDLAHRGIVMGILNVTADSFSDGGRYFDPERALEHAHAMAAAGAEIIDIGGESTRPGAEPVPEEEELRRVLPVIEKLAGDPRFLLSIDTMKPAVARAALQHGAEIVNDVTGLRDPAMRAAVRDFGAGAVIMHMQGTPRTMQAAPHYTDVVAEVGDFFRQSREACLASEMDPLSLVYDPGIGFGKTQAHNLALLRSLGTLAPADRPLALGVSRKSFLARTAGLDPAADRLWPTVALTALGREKGARIFRVHDVRENVHALRMAEAMLLLPT